MACSTAFGRLAKAQRVRRFDGGAKTVRAPQADECAAAKLRPQRRGSYSITSSGLASSVGGTARPSAFAVLSGLKFVRSLVGYKKSERLGTAKGECSEEFVTCLSQLALFRRFSCSVFPACSARLPRQRYSPIARSGSTSASPLEHHRTW